MSTDTNANGADAKRRSSQRSSGAWQQIEDFCRRAQLEDGPASEALGYSRTAVSHWRRAGLAPVPAGLAAEALVRRLGTAGTPYKAPTTPRTFWFRLETTDAEVDTILLVLSKLGVKPKEL